MLILKQAPASTVYTYRDLDGNGVDELILAFKPGKLFERTCDYGYLHYL